MIHQLFHLTRPFVFFDLETTGLDPKTARIVELAFLLYTAEGLQKEYRTYVNPGIPIPPETTAVHHITDALVQGCRVCERSLEAHRQPPAGTIGDPTRECEGFRPWPKFGDIARSIAKGFSNCDMGGKNVRYDLRVLSAEMERHAVTWSYAGACVIDADRLEQLGEPRSLSHLYEKHLGKKMEDAHEALADIKATVEIVDAQMRKYQKLPRDLRQLHEIQWPGFLDAEGKLKRVDGVVMFSMGKHANVPLDKLLQIDRGYLTWIAYKSDFSDEIKALVGKVLAGGKL